MAAEAILNRIRRLLIVIVLTAAPCGGVITARGALAAAKPDQPEQSPSQPSRADVTLRMGQGGAPMTVLPSRNSAAGR